ncbi:MAG: hypothetical protein Ta2D_06280 [Rickettsiales bacterium]|nr:MAG: hypothetical protein Ta2D_06280 [Rickettsiales bacterium]
MFSSKNEESVGSGIIKNNNITILAKDCTLVGNLKSDNILEVEGKIDGDIIANVSTFRESSVIKGNIFGKVTNLKGVFNGIIKSEKVNISSKAKINGTIEYSTISVEDGAEIFADLKRVTNFKEPPQKEEVKTREREVKPVEEK